MTLPLAFTDPPTPTKFGGNVGELHRAPYRLILENAPDCLPQSRLRLFNVTNQRNLTVEAEAVHQVAKLKPLCLLGLQLVHLRVNARKLLVRLIGVDLL